MSKSNKKFMLLSALGIIMVVDAHCWTTLNLFASFIPYNSFFMPMFIFISGYFYTDIQENFLLFLTKKSRKLLLPYVCITVVTLGIEQAINRIKGVYTDIGILEMFRRVASSGDPVDISSPMWFVVSLFLVQLLYFVLRNLFKRWNSIFALISFCLINVLCVYVSKNTIYPRSMLHLFKCLFFMPFFEMGQIYKDKIECRTQKFSREANISICLALLVINMFRMMHLPESYDVAFNGLANMSGFTSPYLVTPLLSSFIGIFFWLTIVDTIGSTLYDNKLVNYISNNTYWIMGFHLTFMNLLNCVLLFWNNNISPIDGFSLEGFQSGAWYRWEKYSQFRLMYFVVGIGGSILSKLIFDKVKKRAFISRKDNYTETIKKQ